MRLLKRNREREPVEMPIVLHQKRDGEEITIYRDLPGRVTLDWPEGDLVINGVPLSERDRQRGWGLVSNYTD